MRDWTWGHVKVYIKYNCADNMNKILVLKKMELHVPFYLDATDQNHKCAGCGAKIIVKGGNIRVPYHFVLCERCRTPVWRLIGYISSKEKLRVID